jgi:hypothetical protein
MTPKFEWKIEKNGWVVNWHHPDFPKHPVRLQIDMAPMKQVGFLGRVIWADWIMTLKDKKGIEVVFPSLAAAKTALRVLTEKQPGLIKAFIDNVLENDPRVAQVYRRSLKELDDGGVKPENGTGG